MKFRSLLGHCRVDKNGVQVAKKACVLQWQDGYRLLVLPDEVRDTSVRFPFKRWSQARRRRQWTRAPWVLLLSDSRISIQLIET